MLVIPLTATPAQTIKVLLNGQDCKISIYQKTTGLFADVFLAGLRIKTAILARDRVALLQSEYLGFVGDLFFKDLQGSADPEYTGLGTRYVLGYQVAL